MAWTSSLTWCFPVSPGQVSTQRAILEVQKHRCSYKDSVDAFVEEAVVRRELAENFCYYNENYDSVQGNHPGSHGPCWVSSCSLQLGNPISARRRAVGALLSDRLVSSGDKTEADECPFQDWCLQGTVASVAWFSGPCRIGCSVLLLISCSQVPMTGHKPP